MARTNTTAELVKRKSRCKSVRINDIKVVDTHRLDKEIIGDKTVRKLKALEKSIRANGVLNPILVKENGDGSYTIVDGVRRYEVAKRLGYKKLQIVSYDDIGDKASLLSLITNSNRKALTPIELGIAYQKLLDSGIYRNRADLAKALGISDSTFSSKIKNLELDKRIIEDLLSGEGLGDQKVLKTVRLIEGVDADGYSDVQYNAYTHIKTEGLKRKEALEYIAGLPDSGEEAEAEAEVEAEQTAPFRKDESETEIQVVIEKDRLEETVVQRIEELLAEIERLSGNVDAAAEAA